MPELALASGTDHGVCWQLASDWNLCAGWQSALRSSRLTTAHAGACLGAGNTEAGWGYRDGAEGLAGEGARKGRLGVLQWWRCGDSGRKAAETEVTIWGGGGQSQVDLAEGGVYDLNV